MNWRHTQVVKGQVCKTFMPRFESGWRLHIQQGKFLRSFPCFLSILFIVSTACLSPHQPSSAPAPTDTPPWSTARHVHWQPLNTGGERAIFLDIGGGSLDALLGDPDVATILNDRYTSHFLHPLARPHLTNRFSWPSVLLLDPSGCPRGVATPKSAAELILFLNEGLHKRRFQENIPIPKIQDSPRPDPQIGTWVHLAPDEATSWTTASQGAPAILWQGTPFLYGNRRDALSAVNAGIGPAGEFLSSLGDRALGPAEHPQLQCTKRSDTADKK